MTKMNIVAEHKLIRVVARFALQIAFASALVLSSVSPALARLACIAANATLNYGPYDVLAGTVLNAAGTITVTCTKSGINANVNGNVTYAVALTPLTPRQLAPPIGTDRLSHQFYTDAARTQPWGDGTGATVLITGTYFVGRNSTASDVPQNFYARITPAGQDVSAASPAPPPTTYTQIFTVTVTCTSPARTC
jgi:spore coat protein U-like protein